MRFARVLQALAWIGYPLLIFFGLHFLEPRYLALLLAVCLLLRRHQDLQRLLVGLGRVDHAILASLLALAALIAVTNSELLLRLYPALVNGGALALFARSLYTPPSMIERFARLQEPDLPPEGVAYTRTVTQVWCGLMAFNTAVSLYTAFYTSREVWALFNGLIVYVLMGSLLAGEWLVRKYVMRISTP